MLSDYSRARKAIHLAVRGCTYIPITGVNGVVVVLYY